eukprot:CAMPEP_0117660092 /NCGR_PEP_ID=MMETSP0804-20121206/6782_1 /TAXON_ID=1074897 /ORGANISM="Tetraselmis astigmatica, Strain CCMP880" /LENGTH=621 /DNA_ID=CAMNT_0005466795 /DNA_START=43 /DNA_END=1908 /DNA_ORIENTATION=+
MALQQQGVGQPQLDASPLPIKVIREQARKLLVDTLDSRRGKKVLVLDPNVSGPLGLIAEVQLLKEHGVDQLLHLSADAVSSEVRNVVYYVRPTLQNVQLIAKQVRATLESVSKQPGSSQLEHSVFFVPRRTTACTRILEEEGILGDITIGEFPLDLVPFESDVLSLELGSAFRECTLDSDPSSLFYVARALIKLEATIGAVPRVLGKGTAAKSVSDLMQRLRREIGMLGSADAAAPSSPQVDAMILLDRQVDLVTPMCTQLTYEGLIDEVLGIHNGAVELEGGNPAAVAGVKRSKVPLNNSDNLFKAMRDINFAAVGRVLRDRALSLQADYQDLQPDTKTVGEMKDFVKKLNSLPELNRHTQIADLLGQSTRKPGFTAKLKVEQSLLDGYSVDAIAEQLEDMMFQMEDPLSVLRLMCVASQILGGLPTKRFDALRREFLLSYGHENMLLFSALQRANLLHRQDSAKSSFGQLKGKLNLIVDNVSESNPEDIAYTFSGYAPISCRLVESALQNGGWRGCEDALKLLPGPSFDYVQTWGENGLPVVRQASAEPVVGAQKTVVVVFIGGITFAEVSALRFLARQRGARLLVVTTKLTNGSNLIESFQPEALQVFLARKAASTPV